MELKDRLQSRGVIDDMSEKNIRRDIEFLGKFGYAVTASKKRSPRGALCHAWAIASGRGATELSAPVISLPELLSLAVARDFLSPLAGTFYWRGISQLIAKLEKIATPELLAYVDAHKEGLVVHPKPPAAKYRSRTLNAINRAIRNTLELSIRYTSLADIKPKTYHIHPEGIVLYDGSIYIAGYRAPAASPKQRSKPASEEAMRFFKLDRVQSREAIITDIPAAQTDDRIAARRQHDDISFGGTGSTLPDCDRCLACPMGLRETISPEAEGTDTVRRQRDSRHRPRLG